MSTFLIKASELILALALLVFVHEFGHYLFSRLFGVKVEKFYLFFNPWFSLFKWKPKDKPSKNPNRSTWRDTEYGIGWLPLGGYCKIAGMIDESMDTEQMNQPAQPWEFRSKPAWQRLFIMVGGVLFNFLLAIVIYSGIVFHWGEQLVPFEGAQYGITYSGIAHKAGFQDNDIPLTADGKEIRYFNSDITKIAMAKQVTVKRGNDTVSLELPSDFAFQVNSELEKGDGFINFVFPTIVKETMNGMGAKAAGLQPGDHIVAVNGTATPSFREFTNSLTQNRDNIVKITLIRSGKSIDVDAMVDDAGKLGVEVLNDPAKLFKTETRTYNLLQSIARGIEMGVDQLVTYAESLSKVFSKAGAKSLGGFGTLGHIFPEKWDWYSFWHITAFLSVILAFMNILPIPALDGGHVLFLLWEVVTRRKPGEKFLEKAQIAGMIFLMLLLLYANANDIYRFLIK